MLNLVGMESEIHVQCDSVDSPADSAAAAGIVLAAVREHYASLCGGERALLCRDLDGAEGMFLANGARLYPDHSYCEYSTPECANTTDAVGAVRAGDQIVRWAAACAQQAAGGSLRISAVRNNRDYAEIAHSCGAHVNIRMTRGGFERILSDGEVLHGFVIPLFVALSVICGSGTVDTGSRRNRFAIWQRAHFLRTIVGPQTQSDRPLVNTRDEPLAADPDRYARLHIIAFDANMAEVPEFCKLGLLRLLCAAVDAGRIELCMELADPIEAVHSVAQDPFASLRRESNGTIMPLEVLGAYQVAFASLQREGVFAGRVPDAGHILARSGWVLEQLRRDPWELIGVLDWPTKLAWLQRFRRHHGLSWSDPRVKWQDIQYHRLSSGSPLPAASHRITTDEQVEALMTHPPAGSRAEVRGALIRRFGGEIQGTDWHYFLCRDGQTVYALPDDPPDGAVQSAERAETLKDYAASLHMDPIPVTPIVIVPCTGRGDSEEDKEACNTTRITKEV